MKSRRYVDQYLGRAVIQRPYKLDRKLNSDQTFCVPLAVDKIQDFKVLSISDCFQIKKGPVRDRLLNIQLWNSS